jgi:hypothetical protein
MQLLCNFHADVSSRFKPSHCNCVAARTLSKTNCHATIMQLLCRRLLSLPASRLKPSHCNCVAARTLSKTNCHATIMQLLCRRLLSLPAFKPHAVNCYFNVTSCKQLPCKPGSTVHHCNPSTIVLQHCNFHYAALQI